MSSTNPLDGEVRLAQQKMERSKRELITHLEARGDPKGIGLLNQYSEDFYDFIDVTERAYELEDEALK